MQHLNVTLGNAGIHFSLSVTKTPFGETLCGSVSPMRQPGNPNTYLLESATSIFCVTASLTMSRFIAAILLGISKSVWRYLTLSPRISPNGQPRILASCKYWQQDHKEFGVIPFRLSHLVSRYSASPTRPIHRVLMRRKRLAASQRISRVGTAWLIPEYPSLATLPPLTYLI